MAGGGIDGSASPSSMGTSIPCPGRSALCWELCGGDSVWFSGGLFLFLVVCHARDKAASVSPSSSGS